MKWINRYILFNEMDEKRYIPFYEINKKDVYRFMK